MKYLLYVLCTLCLTISLSAHAEDDEGEGAGPAFEVMCSETTMDGIGASVTPKPDGQGLIATVYERRGETIKDLGMWDVLKRANAETVLYADGGGEFSLLISRRQARSRATLHAEPNGKNIDKSLECDFGSM